MIPGESLPHVVLLLLASVGLQQGEQALFIAEVPVRNGHAQVTGAASPARAAASG